MRIESKGLAEAIERMKARGERIRDLSPALEFYGEDIVTRTDTCWQQSKQWDGSPFAELADSTLENKATRHAGGGKRKASLKAFRSELKASLTSQRATALAKAEKQYADSVAKIQSSGANGRTRKRRLSKSREKLKAKTSRIQSTLKSKAHAALGRHSQGYHSKRIEFGLSSYKILIDTARAKNSNHVDPPKKVSLTWSAVGYLGFHMTGTTRMPQRNPTPFVKSGGKWKLVEDAQEDFHKSVINYVYRGDPEHGR